MSECDWPVETGCFPDEWESLDPALQARAISLASKTLQRLVGNRVGQCPVTVRPCAPRCGVGLAYTSYEGYLHPQNWAGTWTNACGHLACECDVLCEVILPAPIGRVDEVKVDGDVLNPDTYTVHGTNRLVWTGTGDCPFPATQNLNLADTEEGTFSVTYLNAYPVDINGSYAMSVLALEYAKACAGNSCRLPSGVTTIVRQGVTMEIASGAFPGGLTGIREVDAYIALWNPGGLSRAAQVWSPEMHNPRVV